jgi:hypothetical protein
LINLLPKLNAMKRSSLAFCAAIIIAACNNGPKTTDTTTIQTSDTAGLAEFEAMKAQQAADSIELRQQKDAATQQALVAPVKSTTTHKSTASTSRNTSSSSGSGSATSESSNTASSKKGWSKTAKGAVIGGAVGAGTGAVISKKNRVKGGIIGGVIGAGAGAVIGHDMDKKDGRH